MAITHTVTNLNQNKIQRRKEEDSEKVEKEMLWSGGPNRKKMPNDMVNNE